MVCVEGTMVDGPFALFAGNKDCLWYNIQVSYRVNEDEDENDER